MTARAERQSWYRGACAIALSVIGCVVLAGCATSDNQKPIERTVMISAGPNAVVEQSLGKVIVQYDPNISWRGRIASIDERFVKTLQSEIASGRLFGNDQSSPYKLTATLERIGQTFSFSGTSGAIKGLTVRYSLRKSNGQIIYRRKFRSTADKTDDQAIITENIRQLVSDLSRKLAGLQARDKPALVAAAAPDTVAIPAVAIPLIRQRRSRSAPINLPPVILKSYAAGDVAFGNYYALIIGNNRYRYLKKLKSASVDALALDKILRNDYGFQTKLLIDATRYDILSALSQLRRQLKKQDNLLIYYAGHGWVDDQADEGFWLPIDAASDNPVNWISNSSVISTIRALQAKHVLVVADSCFSGKLTRGLKPQIRTQDYLQRMATRSARTALTSGGLEPVLDGGGQDGHSVFAGAFFSALNANDGVIDMAQLSNRIRRQVALAADQLPEYGDIRRAGHNGGDFLFVRKP